MKKSRFIYNVANSAILTVGGIGLLIYGISEQEIYWAMFGTFALFFGLASALIHIIFKLKFKNASNLFFVSCLCLVSAVGLIGTGSGCLTIAVPEQNSDMTLLGILLIAMGCFDMLTSGFFFLRAKKKSAQNINSPNDENNRPSS